MEEERAVQESRKQMEVSAVDGEIERIQRTVKLIGEENMAQGHYGKVYDPNQVTFEATSTDQITRG